MKFLKLLFFSIFCIAFTRVSAQVEIIDTLTVEELVNDFLLGEGVEATNITFNGMAADQVYVQAGLFQGESDVIDFQEGIIMASVDVSTANGGPGDLITDPVQDDPDLVAIAGQSINDAAIIEFDFVVSSDSVKFDYIFASREYPGFTCSTFNDAFGFFLSGPGISGPFTDNAANIALIPDSDIPVAINTVNSGVPSNPGNEDICEDANANWVEDSQYFVDNSNPSSGDIDIPGLTQTFQAESAVQCGEEYHIKLAIGDAVDGILDSYVVLEAGSFQAFGEIFASFDPVFNEGGAVTQEGFDSLAVAGCTSPLIELTRPTGVSFDTLRFELGGDAVQSPNGAPGTGDYWVPDGFPEGFPLDVDTVNFEIETINPNITDTLDILLFIIYSGCGDGLDTTVVEIPIAPPPEITVFSEDVEVFCPRDSVVISAEAEGGLLPHIFDWNGGNLQDTLPTGSSAFVPLPPDEETYQIVVTDQCEFVFDSLDILVINSLQPPLNSNIQPFADPTCPNEPVDLTVAVNDGNPPYFYQWQDSNNNDYQDNPFADVTVEDVNVVPEAFTPQLEVYSIVTDSCGTVVNDTVTINYPLPDTLSANFGPLTENCPDEPIELDAEVIGGSGDYTYTWEIDYERFNDFPMDNRPVTDFIDGFGPDMQTTYIDAQSGFNDIKLTVEDRCHRLGYSLNYFPDNSGGPELEFFSLGKDTASIVLPVINISNLPNVITPNGDGQNDVFIVPGIDEFDNASVLIYDRWGKLIYENNSYDAGSLNSTTSQGFSAEGYNDGTYFYIVNVNSGECVQQGNIQVLGGSE